MEVFCGDNVVYTTVRTKDGYIESIYDEDGRSGGYLYTRNEFGDDLQEKLNHVAYDYGREKYNAVKYSAYLEDLTSYAEAFAVIRDRVSDRIQSSIDYHFKEIYKLEEEKGKL